MIASAKDYFANLWDTLPDHASPPIEQEGDKFHRGDICKVNGVAMVWLGDRWFNLSLENERVTKVQLP